MKVIDIIIGLDQLDNGKKIRYKETKDDVIKYINYSKRESITITTNDLKVIDKEIFDMGCNFIISDKISDYLANRTSRYICIKHEISTNNPIIEWNIDNKKVFSTFNIFNFEYPKRIRILKDMYNFKNEVKIK